MRTFCAASAVVMSDSINKEVFGVVFFFGVPCLSSVYTHSS